MYEKPGKRGGSMTFAVTETEYRKQDGTLVARARAVGIETGQVRQGLKGEAMVHSATGKT